MTQCPAAFKNSHACRVVMVEDLDFTPRSMVGQMLNGQPDVSESSVFSNLTRKLRYMGRFTVTLFRQERIQVPNILKHIHIVTGNVNHTQMLQSRAGPKVGCKTAMRLDSIDEVVSFALSGIVKTGESLTDSTRTFYTEKKILHGSMKVRHKAASLGTWKLGSMFELLTNLHNRKPILLVTANT
ncbi:uncharacterized protein BDR25DRAFT_357566 [Lindgomyces ingoldianus]|uniref:Uncharacterized protein n=1 Tax=Lindgomyces ingoldianus TaxID=673940 RepID=A0ACB6QNU5_9PLEO|nr:uncharacterized protein BDR25DRAFT_357566 [Lindgomyces ingoldianus]KAF2468633.1 hypothetical protein BDR25DRAFT_357566 [Lindgomyces ingoldianus]